MSLPESDSEVKSSYLWWVKIRVGEGEAILFISSLKCFSTINICSSYYNIYVVVLFWFSST